MAEKCFCHLNGFEVKDAKARQALETQGQQIAEITENVSELEEAFGAYITDIDTLVGEGIQDGNS